MLAIAGDIAVSAGITLDDILGSVDVVFDMDVTTIILDIGMNIDLENPEETNLMVQFKSDINGVQARDRLQGIDGLAQSCNKQLTRTDDPSGRNVNMNLYEHMKWLAAAVQELNEKVDKLLGNE